jgi:class 3 adenylate cyclase
LRNVPRSGGPSGALAPAEKEQLTLKFETGLIFVVIAAVVVAGAILAAKQWTGARQRKQTKLRFRPYLATRVIERAMGATGTFQLKPERREMSVLFSDIRGFTGFSEEMSPQEAVTFLNRYFNRMSSLIFKDGGTLDKFAGDGVMCFWGHPLEVKNHALRATVCALEMVRAVEDLRSALMLPGAARFEIGIGVHTGPMIVGDMGSEDRMTYTVIGDSVNFGSRLESVSRHYGAPIVISEATYQACKSVVVCRELDTIQLKDRGESVRIYEPLGLRLVSSDRRERYDRRGPSTKSKMAVRAFVLARHGERRQLDRRVGSRRLFIGAAEEAIAAKYAEALELYRAGDLDAASMAFDRVLLLNPADGPSRLMKARLARLHSAEGNAVVFDAVYKFDEHEALGRIRLPSLAPTAKKGLA